MPDSEENFRSPEALFIGDYANEFVLWDVSFKDLKGGHMTTDQFVGLYQRTLERNGGVAVRKFSERYQGVPIPQMYADKIEKLDDLTNQINPLFNKFLISRDDKDRDELMKLIEQGMKEIKP